MCGYRCIVVRLNLCVWVCVMYGVCGVWVCGVCGVCVVCVCGVCVVCVSSVCNCV